MRIRINNKVIETSEDLNQMKLRLRSKYPDKNLGKKFPRIKEEKEILEFLNRKNFEKILQEGMDKYDDALKDLKNR